MSGACIEREFSFRLSPLFMGKESLDETGLELYEALREAFGIGNPKGGEP